MSLYIISDSHFYHRNLIKYGVREEGFTEKIIENWQKMLHHDDVTIHLGDVIFARAGELSEILDSIPGRKILVRGNHDLHKPDWYLKHGFSQVCDRYILGNILFTHEPVNKLPDGVEINVHGHLHDQEHRVSDYILQPFNRLVALEHTDYKPVLLKEFLEEEYGQFRADETRVGEGKSFQLRLCIQ